METENKSIFFEILIHIYETGLSEDAVWKVFDLQFPYSKHNLYPSPTLTSQVQLSSLVLLRASS